MSESTSTRVTLVIPAKPGRIFDVLATPHRHPGIDASGTVRSDDNTSPITGIGQVFTMNMTGLNKGGSDDATEFQIDNHVDVFEHNRSIGWRVALAQGPLLGWAWRYDLSKLDEKRTEVALTYDWTGTPPENIARFAVPSFSAADLEASLSLLAEAVQKG